MTFSLFPPPSGRLNRRCDFSSPMRNSEPGKADNGRMRRAGLLALLLLLLPFCLQAQRKGTLTLSQTALAFGNVEVGTAATPQTVIVTAAGNGSVTISSVKLIGAAAFSASETSVPLTLNPGQTLTLTIGFDAGSAGSKSAIVQIKCNGSPSSYSIDLTGTGVTPVLTASATSLVFGNMTVGLPATSQLLTLTSSGTVPLTISGLKQSGAPAFTVAGASFPVTLGPGQTVTLTIGFEASATGSKTGILTVTSNASPDTTTITLGGTAVAAGTLSGLTCSSGSLTGAGTDLCTVSLTAAAGVGGLTVNLASNDANVTVPASVTVAAGAAGATFSASVVAVTTAQTATLTATAGTGAATFGLQLNAAIPTLTLSTSSVSFGNVNLNNATQQTVMLSSTGTAPLTITGATVTGAGFSMSGMTAPVTLNPGQQATLTLQFDPTTAGGVSGTVALTDNASPSSAAISLSGTGVAPAALSALSCAAGSETGAASDACTVSLTAAAPSGGFAVSLASNNAAVTVPSTVTVAAGAATAGFTATVTAVTTAQTATLTATAGTGTATFGLQLNAALPTLTISTSSVNFGDVTLDTPATQTVTLTSSGTAPLTVSGATVSGTGYTVSGVSTPLTLNPGDQATLNVQFDPTAVGSSTGAVSVASNCSMGGNMGFSMSGTGQAPAEEVDLTWDAPTNSSDPVAGYNIYRATSGSQTYQLLNPSPNASTSFTDSTVVDGTAYTYYVESVDAEGNTSGPSNSFSITIPY